MTLQRWHLLVLSALLVAAYSFIEQRYVTERRELVLQQDDIAQALARSYMEDYGPIFLHEGAMYAGSHLINFSDTLANAVKADSGCGLSIFQGDEIIATTMVKPGTQERAIGAHAPAEVKRRVLDNGEAFRKSLEFLGVRAITVVRPLKDGDGHAIGMLATYREVDAFERELLFFRATLGGTMLLVFVVLTFIVFQIERQRRATSAARRALVEDRAKQHAKFFESMTRELRTPLSTLTVFASTLMDAVQDERSRDVVRRMQGETKELLALVDDILDYARLEADSLGLGAEEVDLATTVTRSVEAVRARASSRSIRFDVKIPDDLPKVNGDGLRAQQVVTNIIAAAARTTDDGTIKVRARIERETIAVEVTDGGLGMSESQVMAIWNPFQPSTVPGHQDAGSGLAMAVTKSLIERMGGSVDAGSKRGKGTTFWVRFPRAQVTA
jgi:signal transduction histidine kinase